MNDERHSAGRSVAAGLGLASALTWLLAVPFCPMQIAAALPSGCAALFLGAFVLGCALSCLAPRFARSLARRNRAEKRTARITVFLLPLGTAAQMAALSLGLPGERLWTALFSFVMGWGEGTALLAWGRRLAAGPKTQTLAALSVACVGTAAVALLFGTLAPVPAALQAFLVALAAVAAAAVLIPLPSTHPATDGTSTPGRAPLAPDRDPTHPSGALPLRTTVPGMTASIWAPVLGLGLSFMSAILPWGSFIAGNSVSIPASWSFALGACAVGVALPLAAHLASGRLDFDVAIHIAVPLLAAAVVGLRMVGDLEEASPVAAAIKGMGSGATSAGFLVCAWLAMTRETRAHAPVPTDAPFALGLGVACLIGFAILPAHAASEQAAALVAPFLSLAFLAASCCGSIVHLRRRAETRQVDAPMGIEGAAKVLARRHGLSPREEQVLEQLVLGRSAAGIGEVLGISPNTVRSHVGNIHGKLGIQSRDQLADLIEQTQRSFTDCQQSSKAG